MSSLNEEISKRRTFAIISHPDAGKTTLTEKLLLYGGAINLAGSVKGKRTAKHAVSDWMEIEKQRGISVTSSVLQFKYNGYCINILDTPGHQDFSEDTYRTLMAADSAVMVIDGSKGVERQTIKLFKVCVMRHIPIITFINKMDRDAKNPFDLLEDIENVLGIHTCPVNWPIGSGKEFKGVYDRNSKKILAFTANNGQKEVEKNEITLDDPNIDDVIGMYHRQDLFDDIELLDGAGDDFDLEAVRRGERTNTNIMLEHNFIFGGFTLSAGVLANKNTGLDNDFRFYPGVDMSYRPNDNWKFYASWNKALRMPTYTDLNNLIGKQ